MAVEDRFFPRYIGSDLQFFCMLSLTWLCFYGLVNCPESTPWGIDLIFALGASLVSFLILRLMGYFNPLRILPRRSDILLALVAIPAGGVFLHALWSIFFGSEICPLLTVMTWTPLLAVVIFGSHYGLSLMLLRNGKRKKIVIEVLPSEKASLDAAFAAKDMDEYIDYLTSIDLKRHFLNGKLREISLIIISRNTVAQFDVDGILIRAHLSGIPILDYKKAVTELTGRIPLFESDLWTYVMGATPQTRLLRTLSLIKELLEPPMALALGILFAPLMLVIALAIKLSDGGPVFYTQVRTGYLGRNFYLIKFRSMIIDSEKDGPQWAKSNDSRTTRVGAFLRKTRLDELPQLWNVFRGEMSFFGPRPERPEIYSSLREEIPLFSMRVIVRPGITGWAQVCSGYAASVAESRLKLEYDLYYIQHMSPRLDLIILFKTLMVALLGEDAATSDARRYLRLVSSAEVTRVR